MTDECPPPPSYSSLYQGSSAAAPGPYAPPPPGDGGQTTPQLGAISKASPRQTSLESPFPPSHPFYPGPQGLPPSAPDASAGGGPPPSSGYLPPDGSYPPPQAPTPYAPGHGGYPSGTDVYGQNNPEKPPLSGDTYPPPAGGYPIPPWGGYTQPVEGGGYQPYAPPTGGAASIYPGHPPVTSQPHAAPTDPLINPAYSNMGGAPGYSATGQYPTAQPGTVPHPEIPVIIEDQPDVPLNPHAPQQCTLGKLEDFPDMQIAPGQREHIDQLDPHEKPALLKWCCVAFWSIGAHVSVAVCIFLLVWQVPLKQVYDSRWDRTDRWSDRDKYAYNSATLICASVFLVLCYLVAVIEGCISDTDTYVQNVSQRNEFITEHNRVRCTVPTVVLKAEAFHHAKERIVWKNGRMVDRRRSSDTHRCVSYQEEIAFPFSKCIDASGALEDFKRGVINRFEFEKTFGFLDSATKAEYNRQKESMIARVKDRDEDHSFEETLILPEMKERATVYMEEGCRTAFMSSNFYTCLTFILCTWPYRIFFRLSTRKRKYTFVKLVGI